MVGKSKIKSKVINAYSIHNVFIEVKHSGTFDYYFITLYYFVTSKMIKNFDSKMLTSQQPFAHLAIL
jgi:hypothetical protein